MPFAVPPYRLSGVVYVALLNHRSALAALGAAVDAAPYQGAPKAPVLCLKPRNTLSGQDAQVVIPSGTPEVEVGAQAALVIGRTACNVSESSALDHVAGYLLLADVSVPCESHFRPAVRFKARDGFCPSGPVVAAHGIDPDALAIKVFVDGALVQSGVNAELLRPAARLLKDVSEFMTLAPGDVLALGAAAPAPRLRAGQRLVVEAGGLQTLRCSFTGEPARGSDADGLA
jgi:5-oxopent-3-ene-1,2,5-tricarboxylate decarboxylase/2-hydroxyhepta-2,4-diene-1,7-dioate isomerase